MKIRNLTFWIMAFMFSSCSYEFELNDINVGEKIVLYCIPCTDKDTTLIQLSRSIPVSKKGKLQNGISDAGINFTVNGKEQPVY